EPANARCARVGRRADGAGSAAPDRRPRGAGPPSDEPRPDIRARLGAVLAYPRAMAARHAASCPRPRTPRPCSALPRQPLRLGNLAALLWTDAAKRDAAKSIASQVILRSRSLPESAWPELGIERSLRA